MVCGKSRLSFADGAFVRRGHRLSGRGHRLAGCRRRHNGGAGADSVFGGLLQKRHQRHTAGGGGLRHGRSAGRGGRRGGLRPPKDFWMALAALVLCVGALVLLRRFTRLQKRERLGCGAVCLVLGVFLCSGVGAKLAGPVFGVDVYTRTAASVSHDRYGGLRRRGGKRRGAQRHHGPLRVLLRPDPSAGPHL